VSDAVLYIKTVKTFSITSVFIGVALIPLPALAQAQGQESTPSRVEFGQTFLKGRLTIYGNGLVKQSGVRQFEDQWSYRAYGGDAKVSVRHVITAAPIADVGGSLRLWEGLIAGGGYSASKTLDVTAVSGSVPHPINQNNPRVLESRSLQSLHRLQVAHVFGGWRFPVFDKLDVTPFGGVSFFNLTQGVVTNVTAVESGGPPFAAVKIDQLQLGQHRRNSVGGHVGVDVTYMATRFVGVGFLLRYTDGIVVFPAAKTGNLSLAVGGLEIGGGIRIRF
tara:strand:- start:872 stop:1702 length:831 start_codon:yes stop_codon:yes gene_type:complete